MEKYTRLQKIDLLKKCAEWIGTEGKHLQEFTREFNISKASLYNWSNEFDIDIKQRKRSATSKVCKPKAKSFVKIENFARNDSKQTTINIKTDYCNIAIPEGLSKQSFITLLESLKAVN
jgi:transposase